jgi:DNA repair photolyase
MVPWGEWKTIILVGRISDPYQTIEMKMKARTMAARTRRLAL